MCGVGLRTLAVLALLSLAACGDKVTQAHFQRVQLGMSETEVQKILGTPSHSRQQPPPAQLRLTPEQSAALTLTESFWIGELGSIKVIFQGGKATQQNFFPRD